MCDPRRRSTYKHNQTTQNERTFQLLLTYSSCWMQTYRPVASSFDAASAYLPLLPPLPRAFAPFSFLFCYAMPLLMLLLLMVLLMMKLTPLGGTNSKKICDISSLAWHIQHTLWPSAAFSKQSIRRFAFQCVLNNNIIPATRGPTKPAV